MTPVLAFPLSGVLMNRKIGGVWESGSIAALETADSSLCATYPLSAKHRNIIRAEML